MSYWQIPTCVNVHLNKISLEGVTGQATPLHGLGLLIILEKIENG